jgi:hypothetical protein
MNLKWNNEIKCFSILVEKPKITIKKQYDLYFLIILKNVA